MATLIAYMAITTGVADSSNGSLHGGRHGGRAGRMVRGVGLSSWGFLKMILEDPEVYKVNFRKL